MLPAYCSVGAKVFDLFYKNAQMKTFLKTFAPSRAAQAKKTPPGRPDGGGFCVLTRRSELRCHVVLDPVTLVNMDEHVVQEVDG